MPSPTTTIIWDETGQGIVPVELPAGWKTGSAFDSLQRYRRG